MFSSPYFIRRIFSFHRLLIFVFQSPSMHFCLCVIHTFSFSTSFFSRLPFLIHRFILPSTLLPLCLFFPSLRCLLSFPQFYSYTQFSLCSVFARSSAPITVTCHTIRNIPGLHPCPGFRFLGQYHAPLYVRYCELLSHAHARTHTHTTPHKITPRHKFKFISLLRSWTAAKS